MKERLVKFTISLLTSVFDLKPRPEELSWQDLTSLFAVARVSPRSQRTCLRRDCPHKRGACWSPASFNKKEEAFPRDAEALSLLVFDVDHLTDNQIDKIRERLDGLQYLMHSTHSDRPNSRCLRIVISLSRSVPPDMWRPFFHAAVQSLAPEADPFCADAQRVYFLPSCPHDSIYSMQVNGGQPLDVGTMLAT